MNRRETDKKKASKVHIYRGFVRLLSNVKSKSELADILRVLNGRGLEVISEVLKNILLGNVPLAADQQQKLKRHRELIRAASRKKIPTKKRRELLNSKEGLVALYPIVIPLIVSWIT